MKTNKSVRLLFALLLAITIAFSGCRADPSLLTTSSSSQEFAQISWPDLLMPGGSATAIASVLAEDVPELSVKEMDAFAVKKIDLNQRLKQLQQLYSLDDGQSETENGILTFSNSDCVLMINELGGSYNLIMKKTAQLHELTLTDDQAFDVVKDFVRSKGIRSETLKVQYINETKLTRTNPDGTKTEGRDGISLYLVASDPENPILAQTESLIVTLDSDGAVHSVSDNKTEKDKIDRYPIIDKNTALSRIINGQAVVAGPKDKADTAKVTKMEVIYFQNGPLSTANDGVLQPIILVNGYLDGDPSNTFSAQVPALDEKYYKAKE